MVTLENEELEDTFRSAGALHAVSQSKTAAKIAASHIYEPDVANLALDLISSREDNEDYEIQEYYLSENTVWTGKEYGELFETLYVKYKCLALGLARGQGAEKQMMKLPKDETVLQAGDHVILVVNGRNIEDVKHLFGVKQRRCKEEREQIN